MSVVAVPFGTVSGRSSVSTVVDSIEAWVFTSGELCLSLLAASIHLTSPVNLSPSFVRSLTMGRTPSVLRS